MQAAWRISMAGRTLVRESQTGPRETPTNGMESSAMEPNSRGGLESMGHSKFVLAFTHEHEKHTQSAFEVG